MVGVLALSKKSEVREGLPDECRGTTCPLSTRGDIEPDAERARDLGTAADILLIGGAAIAATGLGLLWLTPSDEPTVTAHVSPGSVAFRTTF